ncbi:MAG TPA: hypothetical protein PLY23_08995 [Alphaproteobacteria bacterium]|nr:hypothetical protein [Alphaproteobacteria bacterium]HQS94751.1 hypothetical protein [Alphaproteobacteria bacterium]
MDKSLKKILEEIIETKDRRNEDEEKRFLELINQTFGRMDLDVARILMKTFLAKPDFGTQERVISAMLSGRREIYIQALLEGLPRLQAEAKNWIENLLCPEIEYHPDILEKLARLMPENIKEIIRTVLNNKDIRRDYPNAEKIII